MEIDYSKYTKQELLDVLENIDREKHPTRYEAAKEALKNIQKVEVNGPRPLSDDELFEKVAIQLGEQASKSKHAVSLFICFAITIYLTDKYSYLFQIYVAVLIGACAILIFVYISRREDLKIFKAASCPLCGGKLEFERAITSRWFMNCWNCKKRASLRYGGLS